MCRNERTFYPPLCDVKNAVPAFTVQGQYTGPGLGTQWSNPLTRSSFSGEFFVLKLTAHRPGKTSRKMMGQRAAGALQRRRLARCMPAAGSSCFAAGHSLGL